MRSLRKNGRTSIVERLKETEPPAPTPMIFTHIIFIHSKGKNQSTYQQANPSTTQKNTLQIRVRSRSLQLFVVRQVVAYRAIVTFNTTLKPAVSWMCEKRMDMISILDRPKINISFCIRTNCKRRLGNGWQKQARNDTTKVENIGNVQTW